MRSLTRRDSMFKAGGAVVVVLVFALGTTVAIWEYLYQTPFGFLADLMGLAIALVPVLILLWLLFAVFAGIWLCCTSNLQPKKRERVEKCILCLFWVGARTALALLVVAHIWMSAQLAPLRREFHRTAQGGGGDIRSTGGHSDGYPVNELDYGGALWDIVGKRDVVLVKHGFLPGGLNPLIAWKTSTSDVFGPGMVGAYLWVPIPRTWYHELLARYLASHRKESVEVVRRGMLKEFEKVH